MKSVTTAFGTEPDVSSAYQACAEHSSEESWISCLVFEHQLVFTWEGGTDLFQEGSSQKRREAKLRVPGRVLGWERAWTGTNWRQSSWGCSYRLLKSESVSALWCSRVLKCAGRQLLGSFFFSWWVHSILQPVNSCKNKVMKSICCATLRSDVIKAKIVKHGKADLKAPTGSCSSACRILSRGAGLYSRLHCCKSGSTQTKSGTRILFLGLFVLSFLDQNFQSSTKLPLHAAI